MNWYYIIKFNSSCILIAINFFSIISTSLSSPNSIIAFNIFTHILFTFISLFKINSSFNCHLLFLNFLIIILGFDVFIILAYINELINDNDDLAHSRRKSYFSPN